uniref:Fe2OG dioxygenase domain-containing protein n=1 Tax=Odontella aurita TaxID=265563 RepID=A0A6U6DZC1_9STRA|mmetsp:Transcript_23216/g.68632  ORF Transcript_23216/g.68632 Transcript_23216/m.68632 type:complete len:239 (+) Transcript_23216:226-942(+)|eukprot:CAMPEP_0113574408 /NCGR_PEP_ID=MMETSP0015_2-20120614/27132_1 /TAXON_ID=2838 /ORGANISM="Odontella" /LENGTH=238 /DNA_ID=CAMNT_0000477545 /DNA_START=87 /DNA_END=803 /DNA_ORIENTATION=- /assembly_acc=CAM_ASM_000160
MKDLSSAPPILKPSERPALFVADSLDDWVKNEGLGHKGLLAKRPFSGAWDKFDRDIEASYSHIGEDRKLNARVAVNERLRENLLATTDKLLDAARLPKSLCEQMRSDACSLGCTVSKLCPSIRALDVKIEIFGEHTCSRWHQDHFVGRALVSYTGAIGTEYTRDSNVDFWELKHCGNNDHIIRDVGEIESVDVGDFLFIMGSKFHKGTGGLIHKSPEKRYHKDGRIVNRLVLKVDIPS